MNDQVAQYLQAWRDGTIAPPPVTRLIGARLTSYGDGCAEVELDASARHHNPFGTVQGGILCAVADVALGVAAATALNAGEGFTTASMTASFIRAFAQGPIRARATVVHRSKPTIDVECDVFGNDELIARVSCTCVIRAGFGVQADEP